MRTTYTSIAAMLLLSILASSGAASAAGVLGYSVSTDKQCAGVEQDTDDNYVCVGQSHAYECLGLYETHSDVCTGQPLRMVMGGA